MSLTAEPFVAKRGMEAHHYEPECHARRLICFLQCQGHRECSYTDVTVSTKSTELLLFLQRNLI